MKKTMINALFCLITTTCSLQAKDVFLVPYARSAIASEKYNYAPYFVREDLSTWQFIDKVLQKSGDTLKATDLSEISSNPHEGGLKRIVRQVICVNLPKWTGPDWQKKLAKISKPDRILIALEPPTVQPKMYDSFHFFGKILTWNDSLVDNKKFFKIHYAVLHPMDPGVLPFAEKKLCTQITCNKKSTHPDELYTARLKVIQYFENLGGNDFEFYGRGWENGGFKNYRGEPDNKHETLKKYRFAFCYENIRNQKGYITEKIFDCFAAGCVPIYLGAPNVKEYIPKNCFISPNDFSSSDALVAFLKNMKEDEYEQYLINIRTFLRSEEAQKFTKKAFSDAVIRALNA